MTLETFVSIAQSANLDVRFAEATPIGEWGPLRDIGFAYSFAQMAVESGDAADAEEGMLLVLETAVVVAVSKDGARDSVRGGWCHVGWTLGNREMDIDEVYERIVAG